MATLASVVIQDLTYTEASLGRLPTISYKNGGTAGSETVTAIDKHIVVTIESGVSTAAQVKTAVEANATADALVTITVTGTGSNAQVTCNEATLSGGTAALKASKRIGGITYEAKTAGTAGNSITVTYTDGTPVASATVGTDITVTFDDGVSTINEIMTAIRNDATANALVTVTQATSDGKQYVHYASSAVSLADGQAATAGSVEVQDLTFSSDLTDDSRNGSKITYTTGATAGSEVVSVSGDDVSIQIENGVSSATQIKAAFDASAAADGIAATGTIDVSDYANLHLTAASGTITYGSPDVLTAASGTVTVVDYTQLQGVAASGTITVLEYADPDMSGATFTVNGVTKTEGVDFNAVTDNDTTATNLAAALDAISGVGASAVNNVVTVVADATGTAGNSIGMSTDLTGDEVSLSGATLASGANGATCTVDGTALVESVDWDAETNNDTTADNLAAAIDALGNVSAPNPAAAAITVTASTAGSAGNSITLATSDAVNLTISGATLSGGLDASTVTVDGSTFTCVSAAPGADEFSSIAELTALVDALGNVGATDDGSVVTVTASTAGTAGNSLAMSQSGSGLTLSGATLSGGIDAATVTVDGNVLTESTDWNAATDNDTTATSLAAAIDALGTVGAAATLSQVTVTAASEGTAGNSIAMLSSDAVRLLLSGATLSGGTDELACTISGTGATAQETVNEEEMTGGVGDGPDAYFRDQTVTALTTAFVLFKWDFIPGAFSLTNRETSGTDTIVFSFDGTNTHGKLLPNESFTNDTNPPTGIWLKYENAAPDYQLFAN
jgi:hypothetical protein